MCIRTTIAGVWKRFYGIVYDEAVESKGNSVFDKDMV